MSAQLGRRVDDGVYAILVVLPYVLLSGLAAAFLWVVSVLRCDESCDRSSAHWSDRWDAWQWHAFAGAGLALIALAVLLVVLATLRRATAAFATLLLQASILFVIWSLSLTDSGASGTVTTLAYLVLWAAFGVGAACFSLRPRRQSASASVGRATGTSQ